MVSSRQKSEPAKTVAKPDGPRKRLAIITTVWRYLSHAQHMGDRFLVGYPWEGKWHRPAIDVVALYVDQKPKDDQSTERARDFGFKVYPTIPEALRCGGEKLAVDGVLIIGEHGDYPRNEKGQILYPRYEFFRASRRRFLSKTAARSRYSTTSTCRSASPRPKKWSRRRSGSSSRFWPVHRSRSRGGCLPSSSPEVA